MSLTYYARGAASAQRARDRINREGFTLSGQKLWTAEENTVLRQLAPNYAAMRKALPHRTAIAIESQCGKLRLTKAIHIWTGAEISKLRRLYPSSDLADICLAFPHSTWINISQVARYHGFRRLKKPYKPTGFPAIDQIRMKCDEHKLSMPDLDDLSGTKNYFGSSKWFGKKRPNYRAIGKAVEALDGKLDIKWKQYD